MVIEIDTLIKDFSHLSPRSSLVNGIEKGLVLIKKAAKEGSFVIVPFPLSEGHYNYFTHQLQTVDTLVFFTLCPPLEVVLRNRGTREISQQEQKRIQDFYYHNLHQPKFGISIDNSKQNPNQTVDRILKYLF